MELHAGIRFKMPTAYSNIKRSRYPLLFDDAESGIDKYTLDRATIEQELQRSLINESGKRKFRMRSEVISLSLDCLPRRYGFFVLDGKLVICCKKRRPPAGSSGSCCTCTRLIISRRSKRTT
jgi:hypothetical protein